MEFVCVNIVVLSAEMQFDSVIWVKIDGRLFMPAGVLETEDHNQVIVALFDVTRPNNKRKIHRQKIIPYFNDKLNMELLVTKQINHGSLKTNSLSFSIFCIYYIYVAV